MTNENDLYDLLLKMTGDMVRLYGRSENGTIRIARGGVQAITSMVASLIEKREISVCDRCDGHGEIEIGTRGEVVPCDQCQGYGFVWVSPFTKT